MPVETGYATVLVAEPIADPCSSGLPGLAGERHFSRREIAERRALSECKIRRMFEGEPGVLRIGEPIHLMRALIRFTMTCNDYAYQCVEKG